MQTPSSLEMLLLKVRQRLQSLTSSRHLEGWLEEVELDEDPQGGLILKCPNRFSMQWLSGRHREALSNLFREEVGRDVHLTFQLGGRSCAEPTEEGSTDRNRSSRLPTLRPKPSLQTGRTRALEDPPLQAPFPDWNPRFRFSTFVAGRSNGFAWSAAQEVARQFRREYNPLLIHASTGLGKTHLGQAIGCRCFQQNEGLRILCCTAEGFFAEMIRHLRSRTILSFKDRYREACDILILDDIQFLKGKDALQAELCHTLDILLNRGKQVILLGNLPSRDRNGLDENLESRIFSGLAVTMEPPEYETRLAILNQFAHTSGIPLSEETLATVARRVCSHVRDLEGAFGRLTAMQSLSRERIDPETADRLFQDARFQPKRRVNSKTIQDHVAKYFGLDPEMLSSRSRKRNVHYPRQVGMYLSRKHTFESLESIGDLYNRDHASVLHALRSLERKMRSNARIAREVQFIEEKLLDMA